MVMVPGTVSAYCGRNKNWSENNTMPLKKSDTTSCLSIQMTVDILVFLVGNTELNCYDDKSEHTFKVLTINFWKYLPTRRHFLSYFCAFFGQIARVYVFTKRNLPTSITRWNSHFATTKFNTPIHNRCLPHQ